MPAAKHAPDQAPHDCRREQDTDRGQHGDRSPVPRQVAEVDVDAPAKSRNPSMPCNRRLAEVELLDDRAAPGAPHPERSSRARTTSTEKRSVNAYQPDRGGEFQQAKVEKAEDSRQHDHDRDEVEQATWFLRHFRVERQRTLKLLT